METKRIEIIIDAVQEGSFSKTAEKVGYSPSALVHMTKKLEEEIGVRILKRDSAGVSFTEEGLSLLPYMKQIVRDDRLLMEKAQELSHRQKKEVHIAAFPSFGNCLLHPINRTLAEQSDIRIDIKICSEEICDLISRGEADLGFTSNAYIGDNEWIPLQKDQMLIVLPKFSGYDHLTSMPLAQVTRHPVMISQLSEKNSSVTALKKVKGVHLITIKDNGAGTLFRMVDEGRGFAFLSSMYRPVCPGDLMMLPLAPPYFREIGIIARSLDDLSPASKLFVKHARQYFEEVSDYTSQESVH